MSKNPVLYKSLVVGVIVLFIGIGIQPAIAIVEPESVESDDDCNLCPSNTKESKNDNSLICARLFIKLFRLSLILQTIYILIYSFENTRFVYLLAEIYWHYSDKIDNVVQLLYANNCDYPFPP